MKKIILFLLCTISLCAQEVIEHKVVICGVCKDVSSQLPRSIRIMEEIGSLFKDYRIIVYENNSTDSTKSILKKWERKNNKVFAQCDTLDLSSLEVINHTQNGGLFRPELIARARNIVLDIALSDSYKDFTYLIWMDMDFTRMPNLEGLLEVFQTGQEWDAVFAYGIDPSNYYWDWYAFRDFTYNPLGSELLGDAWWQRPNHQEFKLTEQSDWYPVTSAFSGCGIYKKSSVVGCRYSATVTEDLEKVASKIIDQGKASNQPQILNYLNSLTLLSNILEIKTPSSNLPKIYDPTIGFILHKSATPLIWKLSSDACQYPSVCEHVSFHASMIAKGHDKLFINPRMVFTYGDKFN